MNYRHAFHAGNFADVVKHAAFARVVAYLKEKPSPFRIIDTHAGAGLYDLSGPEATRSGEWREGIGRLVAASLDPPVRALLAPYLDAVVRFNEDSGDTGRLAHYPGSPLLAQAWLRPGDRLVACELEPAAAAALAAALRGKRGAKAVAIDGYTALKAYMPPKERRGVVLIDPPFEADDEFSRLATALAGAHAKWATGIYLAWYPIKDRRAADAFTRQVARLGLPRILRAELALSGTGPGRLSATGLLAVNPPWRLEQELKILLPALAAALAADGRGRTRLDWLTGEK